MLGAAGSAVGAACYDDAVYIKGEHLHYKKEQIWQEPNIGV